MGSRRFERIARINAARWDQIVAGRPFASHGWLAYGERVLTADRPFYQVATAGAGPGLASVSWLRRREQLPISAGFVRAAVQAILHLQPLVTCQTPIAGLSGLFARGSEGLDAALPQLAGGMIDVLDEVQGSFLIVPYLEPELAAHPGWGSGFLGVEMPANTYLQVRWTSFDDFVSALRRTVRKDYRRHRSRSLRLKLRTEIRITPPDPARIRELVRAVERKHRAAPLPHLDELIRARPLPGGKWIAVEREGSLVGCGLMLRDRRSILLTALGVAENSPNVYFELMYGAIAHAIETGAEGIFGGGGAYQFKERLGFQRTTDTRVLFYARNARLRRLGAWLAGREGRTMDRSLRLELLGKAV